MNDLCDLPAHELVRLMSSGTVSCREVMEAHLARIDDVNPRLNALVEPADPQQCLDLADDADNRAARGEPLGAAHGLPVAVKDVMRVAGWHAPAAVPFFGRSHTTTRRWCRDCGPKAPSWSA